VEHSLEGVSKSKHKFGFLNAFEVVYSENPIRAGQFGLEMVENCLAVDAVQNLQVKLET
jgi:hypothetical protein